MSLVADPSAPAVASVTSAGRALTRAALVADLAALAREHAGGERELRTAVAHHLKGVLAEGRAQAERLLIAAAQKRSLCRTALG